MNNKNHQRTETEKISSSKSDMIEKEDIVRQLGFLMRFANRINNTNPELVNDSVRIAIEKAKGIIKNNSTNDSKIIQS